MFVLYLTVTLLAAAATGVAATANLVGHEYPKRQADQNRVPRSWVFPLGLLLAAGALGLLAGIVVPAIGVLAAGGLVLYFVGAFVAHLRARNWDLRNWAGFFLLAVAALIVNLAHHQSW